MKTEADFVEGSKVIFVDANMTTVHEGTVDYSYGDEKPGHIRVDTFLYGPENLPDSIYVLVEQIL